jgi:hypothetical protein
VLRRLGLHLAGGLDVGHERHVQESALLGPASLLELADRLEERERFDVADGAADLDDGDVDVRWRRARVFDLVGDVRDDLHGGAEVLAAALLGDDRLVDAAGGEVVVFASCAYVEVKRS